MLGWEQCKGLWTLCLWRFLWTGDHVRVSHTGFLHSSQWFDGDWEQLWPWVDTIGCFLSIKAFTKIPEGRVEIFNGSKLFGKFREPKFLKQEEKLFSGMYSLVLLKMSWPATSPWIASVSAGNWKNYLPFSKDAGEKVLKDEQLCEHRKFKVLSYKLAELFSISHRCRYYLLSVLAISSVWKEARIL